MRFSARHPRLSALLALPPIAIGVAVAMWLVSGAQGPAQEETAAPGLAVRVAPVAVQDIVPTVRGWGAIRAADRWAAVSEVRGQVVWRHPDLEAGRIIRSGTEVLHIDPTEYQLAISQAKAELQALLAEEAQIGAEVENTRRLLTLEQDRLALAEADLVRVRDLVGQGVSPQTRADEAEKSVLQARRTVTELQNTLALIPSRTARIAAQRAGTQAALDRAQRDLDHTVVSAPFDLRVVNVDVETYQPVNVGQPLVEGDGLARAEVVAQVPLDAFRRLLASQGDAPASALEALGQGPAGRLSAQLHPLADPGQVWPATVTRIEAALDPRARTVPVVVVVQDPYGGATPPERVPLVPNMQVEVTLQGQAMRDVVAIPEGALHGQTVYVAGADDRLELRPVDPWFRQDGLVVLRGGLEPGTHLVLDDIAPALPGMQLQPVGVAN